MTKVIGCRISDDTNERLSRVLEKLDLKSSDVLHKLIDIFLESFENIAVNGCKQAVNTLSFENQYQHVREQVDEFLRDLEADKQ